MIDAVGDAIEAKCEGGAWIALIQGGPRFSDPPVRFETAAAEIVRPPLPKKWTWEPVPDATETCPACGAAAWERVTPTDDSRGSRETDDGDWEPSPVVVCIRCGHEESEGSWIAVEDDEEDLDPEAATEAESALARHRQERLENLRGLMMPVYALEDPPHPPALGGWGGDDQGVHSVTVRHGDGDGLMIEIRTERRRFGSATDAARVALENALHDLGEWPDVSQPALALWLRARERERRAESALAERFEVEIPVAATTVAFEGVRSGHAWAVVGTVDQLRIIVTGRQRSPDGIRLRKLDDAVTELAE